MTDDVQRAYQQAAQLPYGTARNRALEIVVARAENLDEELAFAARLDLAQSYVMGGERRKLLVPFTRCLADYDADPERYGRHRYQLFWEFKFVPSTLVRFPEVPLDMTLRTLDDMEAHYRAAGQSMHAVHQYRHVVAHHVGDTATAAEEFRLWQAAPRDELSDCLGCDPSARVEYLTEEGRYADAVAIARPVLSGAVTCSEQPQEMQSVVLEALVAEGLLDDAVAAHRQGYRALRGEARHLGLMADHLRFCTLTGNHERALEIVDTHLPLLDRASDPWSVMQFCAASALALSRVDPDVEVRHDGERRPAAVVAETLAERATSVAATFDARNGTDRQSRRVREVIGAETWLESLPLSEVARRAAARRAANATAHRAPAPGPDPAEVSTDHLLDESERLRRSDDLAGALRLVAAYEERVPEADRTPYDVARVGEARAVEVWQSGDLDRASEMLGETLVRYDALGQGLRARRTRGRLALILLERGEVEESVATGEEVLRELAAHDDPERRASWTVGLARILVAAGRAADALDAIDALPSHLVADIDVVPLAFVHGQALGQTGQLPAAEEQFSIAVDRLSGQLAEHPARLFRARTRLQMGRPLDAVADLVEAVAIEATLESNPWTRIELAEAYLQAGDAAACAEVGEAVLHEGRIPVQDLPVQLHVALAEAYHRLEQPEQAMRHLSVVIEFATAEGDGSWLMNLLVREASHLVDLGRPAEGVDRYVRAARMAKEEDDWRSQVVSLRRASDAALAGDEATTAAALLDEAATVLGGLDRLEPEVAFHLGGIELQRATGAEQAGRAGEVIPLLKAAEEAFHAGGLPDMVATAVIRQVESGEARPIVDLEQARAPLSVDTWQWAELGYLVADQLRASGRTSEAGDIEREIAAVRQEP